MFSKKAIEYLESDDLYNPVVVGQDRHGRIVEATTSEGNLMRGSLKKLQRVKTVKWYFYTGNVKTWHRGY